MSSNFRLAIMLSLSAFLFAACQSDFGNLYGYDFKTAKISYQITGSSVGQSEVLVKGEMKKIHNQITQTKVDGSSQKIDTILIQNGDKLYSLDPATKTGSMTTQPFYAELKQLPPEQRQQRMITEAIRDNRSPEEQQQNPLKPQQSERIAGQSCDLYVIGANLQTCLWQGIPLKAIASLPDYGITTETTATSIELNQDISDSEFDVPQDYQITELN